MSTYRARKEAATKSRFSNLKLLTTSALTAAGILMSGSALAQDANKDWDDANIVAGSANVNDTGIGLTEIDQFSGVAVGEIGDASIGVNATVTIGQNTRGDLFVLRDTEGRDPSKLLGTLRTRLKSADGSFTEATGGDVMVNDVNGVIVGENARIDVNSIILSTGQISNADAMDRNIDINNFGDGEIVIESGADITVAEGGVAAFVAPTVKNAGVINAKLGKVAFAAGEAVTVDLYGDGLFEVEVQGELADAYLENTGEINAAGGTVQMTALAAKRVADDIINLDGVVDVSSATEAGGKIVLDGGQSGRIDVRGKLDASGATEGGKIDVQGERIRLAGPSELVSEGGDSQIEVIASEKAIFRGKVRAGENADVEISGNELVLGNGRVTLGEGSNIAFDPVNLTIADSTAIETSLNNNGVNVDVTAENTITLNDAIDTSAQTTNSTLNFNDENADGDLTINLNAEISLGANQTLGGEATTVNVATTGSIQNAVDVSASAADVNLASGTFTEGGITIDKEISLNGDAAGSTIQATSASPIITVEAANVSIDAVDFDGAGVGEEAIRAVGAGANGLTVTNGEFADFSKSAIFVGANNAGIASINNNIFAGSNNRAISTGTLDGGFTLEITDNTIGAQSDEVFKGIEIARVKDATVNITGGTINSQNDGISLDHGVSGEGTVNISNIDVESTLDDALDVQKEVADGGALNIDGGVFYGQKNGIELAAINGDVLIQNATIIGEGEGFHGINLQENLGGTLTLTNNSIWGDEDGIGSENENGGTVDGGTFTLTSGFFTAGDKGDAIQLGKISNGGDVNISGSGFSSGENDVNIVGGVDNATLDVSGVTGFGAEESFVVIAGDIVNGSTVTIENNNRLVGEDGVRVEGDIDETSTLNVNNNTFRHVDVDVNAFFQAEGRVLSHLTIIPGVVASSDDATGVQIDGTVNGATIGVSDNTITDAAYGIKTAKLDGANVTFDGNTINSRDDAAIGIKLGSARNGTIVDITNNTIGGDNFGPNDSDAIFKGITASHITDSTVNISGGSIESKKATVALIQGVGKNSSVNIDGGAQLTSIEDDGIEAHKEIAANSSLNIKDVAITSKEEGIETSLIAGILNVGSDETTTTINAGGSGIKSNQEWLGAYEDGAANVTNVDIDAGENGVELNNVATSIITNNRISAGLDGVKIADFNNSWISYNRIINTGDDGIEAAYGNFVSIYENYIDLAGFESNDPAFGNTEVGQGEADGINVTGVSGAEIPEVTEEIGAGGSIYGASVEIYGNEIANVSDDAIEVSQSDSAYITTNIVGHAGGNGVNVSATGTSIISENAISSVEINGVLLNGGRYAGIFDNRILLTGEDGINVSGTYGGEDAILLGAIEYGFGWSVNVAGNEIAMTGDDGIEVSYAGPTQIQSNNIFMAGMGEDLGEAIDTINTFASQTGVPPYTTFSEDETFGFSWGDGHGINVHGVTDSENSPNGFAVDINGNTVKYAGGHGILAANNGRTNISNNPSIQYTGLDYTVFSGAGNIMTALTSGPFDRENEGRRDLWQSEGSMVAVLDSYFGIPTEEPEGDAPYITVEGIEYDNFDGIHANNIFTNYGEYNPYLFDLTITGNNIDYTGDDGIEVRNAGRTLIEGNNITHAGFGEERPYEVGDYDGADGIRVTNVTAELYPVLVEPKVTDKVQAVSDFEETEGDESPVNTDAKYAVVIRGNNITYTGDDGIEVVGSGYVQNDEVVKFGARGIGGPITDNVLIEGNTIEETGYYNNEESDESDVFLFDGPSRGYNVGADGFGHDGIHVRNVTGVQNGLIGWPVDQAGFTSGGDTTGGFYGYAVDILGNTISKTGDDGIEVYNSKSTLITENTISETGVYWNEQKLEEGEQEASIFEDYGSYDGAPSLNTDGADYYGADGIHVRNVGGEIADSEQEQYLAQNTSISGNEFQEYAVAIVNNDVQKTADDGIEVVGTSEEIYNDYDYAKSSQEVNIFEDYGAIFTGTGRTLITENTIADAGVSGVLFYYDSYGYDSRGGSEDGDYGLIGNLGAQDGFGGDGISVRGVKALYGEGYDVEITLNEVERTGDDGIEVIGSSENKNRPRPKFGAEGIGEAFYDYGFGGGPTTSSVLVEENFVRDSGLTSGMSIDVYNNYSGNDEDGYYYGYEYLDIDAVVGNIAQDGLGADGIHVSGITSGEVYPYNLANTSVAGSNGNEYTGYAVDIINNNVRRTADDGIEVANADSTLIAENIVNDSGFLSGNYTLSSYSSESDENSYESTESSINFWKGESAQSYNYKGADGISVSNVGEKSEMMMLKQSGYETSNGIDEYAVVVYDNFVNNSSDDGVEVSYSDRTRIEKNEIKRSGTTQYRITENDDVLAVEIDGATVRDGFGSDGISVNNVQADDVLVFVPSEEVDVEPTSEFSEIGGTYEFQPVDAVEIVGNTVSISADDGIQVTDSGNTLIGGEAEEDGNTVTQSGTAKGFGEEVFNDYGFGGPRILSFAKSGLIEDSYDSEETLISQGIGSRDETGGDGINVSSSFSYQSEETDVKIIGNTVSESADDGIEVSTESAFNDYGFGASFGETNVLVSTNDIDESGYNGIALVTGYGYYDSYYDEKIPSISLVSIDGGAVMNSEIINNTVDDSDNNGLLVEGPNHQDVIAAGNTFTNNPTGARFESGAIDLTGPANTFTVTPDFVAPEGFDFVTGLQFELANPEDPTSLTIVEETLGTTIFEGYSTRPVEEAFYVRFEDGAILDAEGNVIVIDATFSSFDTIIPNETGNFLSADELTLIEDRLFDADDEEIDGRGQIFVGELNPLNPEDFLQDRGVGQFGTSGLNVTVTALPAIDGASLASIEPAAGGEGETPEDLANLEPAAGGEEVKCIGQAIDAASAGGVATYSFGGTFEESISNVSACGADF